MSIIPDRAQSVFYYDGGCGFCASVVMALSRLDLRRRVAWVPYQSLETPPESLTWEDLERSAYLETGQSGLHEGFHAFRGLTLLLLPLWPLAAFLWLPGMPGLGTRAYRRLAGNRYGISRCWLLTPNRRRWTGGRRE